MPDTAQRFRQLTLRGASPLRGEFELREVPAGDGKTVTAFVGTVDDGPGRERRENVLARWEEYTPAQQARIESALADPAGQYIVVPVGAVTYAVPIEPDENGCKRCGRFSWFLHRDGICGACCNEEGATDETD